MKKTPYQVKFLIGSILLIVLLADSCFAGHKDDDDDDDDDDDPQCYLGRNCRPGCYCSGTYCRPYFHPASKFLARYQCTGYNYPKWKIKTKGHKHGGKNSTIMAVIDPYYREKTESSLSAFFREKNFTTYDESTVPSPVLMASQYSKNVSQPDSGKVSLTKVAENGTTTTASVIDLVYTSSSVSSA